MGVNYNSLIGPVVEAIKTLYYRTIGHERKIASIEDDLSTIKTENERLKKENEDLKKRLEAIEERLGQ